MLPSDIRSLTEAYQSIYTPKEEIVDLSEGFLTEELFDLTDEEIQEQVEEFFLECVEEGYDIDDVERIIYEHIDSSLEILSERVDPKETQRRRDQAKDRLATGAAMKKAASSGSSGGEKSSKLSRLKSAVGKAASAARAGAKAGAKAAGRAATGGVGLAARAVGTAQRAGSAVKSAAKSGYERGRQGSEGGSSSSSGGGASSSSGSSSGGGGSSSSDDGEASAAPAKRKGGLLKRALKKVVRGAAKVVSTGAGAVKAGADYVADRARKEELEATGLFSDKEIEAIMENIMRGPLLPGEGRKVYPKGAAPKKTGATLPLANSHEPEGEVLEAAVPHTNVYYDKHMKRIVPMSGGTAAPRASKKPTTQMAGYKPEGEIIEGYVSVEDGVIYLEGNQGPSTPVRVYTFPDGSKRIQPYVGGAGVPLKLVKKKPTTQMAGYKPEGDQLDEFLGGVPGDGYIGHPNLDIKNPFNPPKGPKKPVLPQAKPGSGGLVNRIGATLGDRNLRQSYEPEGKMVDEARRADKEGYARGTKENPERKDIPHGDVSQRSMLHSRLKRRADEMGRERRSSARNKAGGRTPVSKKEKAFLRAADRTASQVRNPNVPKTGEHKKKIDENVLQDIVRTARRFNPGAALGAMVHNAVIPPVADGTLDTAARNASPGGRRPKDHKTKTEAVDYILDYLMNEGFAKTEDSAKVIMSNMSEAWIKSILEQSSNEINIPDSAPPIPELPGESKADREARLKRERDKERRGAFTGLPASTTGP